MIVMILILFTIFHPHQDVDLPGLQAAYEYLFSGEEKAAFDKLTSSAQRKKFWDDFWLKRDPSPMTDYNEVMELFLGRVEQSKLSLSTNEDGDNGWQTDRGKILIYFGPPREILRSPFSPRMERKVEVWVYTKKDDQGNVQRVELKFVDPDGSGRFSLTTNIKYPRNISLEPTLPEVLPEGDG